MRTFPQRPIGATCRLVALVSTMLLVGAACSGGGDTDPFGGDTATGAVTEQASEPAGQSGDPDDETAAPNGDSPALEQSPVSPASTGSGSLADQITELPPAPTGLPVLPPPDRRPTGLTIDSLGVNVATVIGVGVEDNGDMEIPPADEVGWYQYGPSPGASGSSVLAAHIAFDGQDGVFVELDDIELGSLIEVSYDDGTTAAFEAVSKQQYDKAELPQEEVWGRDGDPRLVLITCGGDFNRRVRSYEDNIVVYANPVDLDQS